MKRLALYLALTLALVVAFVPGVRAQGLNYLTAAQVQARAWTFALAQTFKGIKFSATTNSVTADGMKLDADTGDLQTYKGGALSEINRGTSWQPGFCPPDVNDMGVGFCYDTTTGKMKIRDAAGLRDL